MQAAHLTRAAVLGYFQCARKAYLHLFSGESAEKCEYTALLDRLRDRARARHRDQSLRQGLLITPFFHDRLSSTPPNPDSPIQSQTPEVLAQGHERLSDALLVSGALRTECAFLTRIPGRSTFGDFQYEPIVVSASHDLRPEDRLDILYAGHVLSQVQSSLPTQGSVLLQTGALAQVRLAPGLKHLQPALATLQQWLRDPPDPPPAALLNKHCHHCEFRRACRATAEQDNSLSLLDGITPTIAARYEKKGIFTLKQLSYLYKPRKPSRRRPRRITHQFELQALALRTGNIYLNEPLALPPPTPGIFLDIEALPDRRFYYLIGLVHSTAEGDRYLPFWADTPADERTVWKQCLAYLERHPGLPIFHYGSFETRAITVLGKRYATPVGAILKRLFNVNTCVFGRVYFPTRSNGLKSLCHYLGLKWTAPDASGLQSIVWRHRYEDTGDPADRERLVTYNQEDCAYLKILTQRLRDIVQHSTALPEVRLADTIAGDLTPTGSGIVSRFSQILKSAHLSYQQSKIILNRSKGAASSSSPPRKSSRPSADFPQRKKLPKAHKIVTVRPGKTCPHHPGKALTPTQAIAQHTVTDLVFTPRGVKKTLTRFTGLQGFCGRCKNKISPPAIRKLRHEGKYGHGLKAWTTYHRLALRLPYRNISQLLEDLFDEHLKVGTLLRFLDRTSQYYARTEKRLLERILRSPVIHADETSVNIQGKNWYVWVFTDGRRAVFRLTPTRESTIVHELLAGYPGVLVSDFYAGYDAVDCAQQKCWAHIIRDLNEDLRGSPFDAELERFVAAVRDLIVPIFESAETRGLKTRTLAKFATSVERFYAAHITDVTYKSDLAKGYQKRFARYRTELFLFLHRDAVPWNNNMAERAIRHLAVQRKISGSFSESGLQQYLLLLGITQSCRFQSKSLLEFLLCGSKDLDAFNPSRRNRTRS